MKRQQYLGCLLASCVLILTACGTVQPISGQVVERTTEEDGTLSAFVVETHTGERISLTMTEKTRVFSWVDGRQRSGLCRRNPGWNRRIGGDGRSGRSHCRRQHRSFRL